MAFCAASSSVNFCGMNTWVKVGCTVLFIQARVDNARVRARPEAGRMPACGNFASRCSRMATICVITSPSSTSTGTWPRGFIARYSGLRCSPLCSLTMTGSNGTPASSSMACGTKEQAPGAKNSLRLMDVSLYLSDR